MPPSAEFDLENVGEAVVYHYPGMGKMRVKVFPADQGAVRSVSVASSSGTFALEPDKDGAYTALMPAPAETGAHPVSIAVLTDGGMKRFDDVWTLEKRKFEWEGNRIGEEKVVIPPFSPVAIEGDDVKVTLRDYRFGAAGVLRQFAALGREMLAGPMYFEISADGKTGRFGGEKPKIEVRNSGHDAALVSSAEAGGVVMKTDGVLEYDGFIWNRVRLSGVEGRNVERLTLVIPLKDAEVPLMHICTADSIRHNPTGKVPAGEGVVWEGTRLHREGGFVDLMYASQAVPYVWLGAERRGLSWFVNNTAGMRLAKNRPAVRIVRKGGVLMLEVDFINVPSRLREGHAFAYGLEATPVKTPDRRMYRHFQTEVGPHPENWVSRFEARQALANFWNRWSRKPVGDDWTAYRRLFRQITEATPESAAGFRAAFDEATNRTEAAFREYCGAFADVGRQTRYDWAAGCRDYALRNALALKDPAYPFRYSDPTLTWEEEEDVKYYRSEWISRPCGYTGATRNFLTPSYLDYIVYYYKKDIDCGLKGLYFDDMFPMTCRNPDTEMTRDDEGAWHGNFGILEMRELVKRTATMQHLAGVEPRLQQIHMTNCLLVPSFAFATSMLSWEDHYGEKIFQHRFPLDYVRAESLGSQVGAEAVALDGIHHRGHDRKDWDERYFAFLTRTQQAILLPGGVKIWLRPAIPGNGVHREELFKILGVLGRFEIWADDSVFVPFYEDDGAVKAVAGKTLVGTYRRPGRTLAIIGNQTGEDLEFTLLADAGKLKLKGNVAMCDGETGEKLPGGKIRLPAWDLRLVIIGGEDDFPSGTSRVERIVDIPDTYPEKKLTRAEVRAHQCNGRLVRIKGVKSRKAVDFYRSLGIELFSGADERLWRRPEGSIAKALREVRRLDDAAEAKWFGLDLKATDEYRNRLKRDMVEAIGGLPERTPLNAKTVETCSREGFRLEKVIYESQRDHHVTAYLFLPDPERFKPPYPGVLIPLGHADKGKARAGYFKAGVVAARAGMAALAYDPVDQGERRQLPEAKRIFNVAGHVNAGMRAHLVGWNFSRFRIWDAMRSLDYLQSRPEVDRSRLAVMGQSGGGTVTAYVAALDPRIKVSCPAGFVTASADLAEVWGPQDSEQNIPGAMKLGLNHLSLMMMAFPAPVRLVLAENDAFPIYGSRRTYFKLRELYARSGIGERVGFTMEKGKPHGWYDSSRNDSVRWIRRFLTGVDAPAPAVSDAEAAPPSGDGALVAPKGGVMAIPGERSVYDIIRGRMAEVESKRPELTRELVIAATGINPDPEAAEPENLDIVRNGFWSYVHSPADELAVIYEWLGTSLVAKRAERFIFEAKRFAAANGGSKMTLKADGRSAIPAAHAWYLRPDLFAGVEITNPPLSWRDAVADPCAPLSAQDLVFGALKAYDWIDLLPEGNGFTKGK